MAAGAETYKTFATDSTGKNVAIECQTTDASTCIALGSFLTEKKSSSTSALISATGPDVGSIESTSNLMPLGNSMHCYCSVGMSTSGAGCSIALALFCNPTTAGLVGITEINAFTATTWRQSTGGDFLCPRYIYDCAGAAYVKPVVFSITTASTANICLRPL